MDISPAKNQNWQSIAAAKRKETMSKVPKEWLLLTSVLTEDKARKQIAWNFIESLLDAKKKSTSPI